MTFLPEVSEIPDVGAVVLYRVGHRRCGSSVERHDDDVSKMLVVSFSLSTRLLRSAQYEFLSPKLYRVETEGIGHRLSGDRNSSSFGLPGRFNCLDLKNLGYS